MTLLLFLSLTALVSCASASASASAQKQPHALPGRSAVVHLFEWTFEAIAGECERVLAPLGYAAVQTSPVNEHLALSEKGHPWWERYQPVSYKIISRSGNETAFAEMVKRCNNVGIRVYVDVVLNHMTGPVEDARGVGGSKADGIRRQYFAVPYSSNDFNDACDIHTYNDANQVRNCLLSGLNDLNQASEYVCSKIVQFLNKLIDYGVAGFRIDAAKHMWPKDLQRIYSSVKDLNTSHGFAPKSRPFIYQEVIDLGGEGVKKTEYNGLGRVTEFKYGAELGNAFRGNNDLKWLVNFGIEWGLLPSEDALVFIDNHDNQRGHGAGGSSILTHREPKLYKMAVVFMLSWPYGCPRVMSSFFFNDTDAGPPQSADGAVGSAAGGNGTCADGWVCEHRWPQIAQSVAFRNNVEGTQIQNWWDNGKNQIAYSRGDRGFVAINGERESDLKQTLQTGLPQGTYCDIISGSKFDDHCTGKVINVRSDGKAFVSILKSDDEGVVAVHTGMKLKLQ